MGKLAHLLEQDSPTTKTLADQLHSSRQRDAEWVAMLANVDHEMEELCEQMEAIGKAADATSAATKAQMDAQAAQITEIAAQVQALKATITTLVRSSTSEIKAAVGGIRMPAIPEQVQPDLTPVIQAMRMMNPSTPLMPTIKLPKDWVFEVDRGPNGFIYSVTAKAVE